MKIAVMGAGGIGGYVGGRMAAAGEDVHLVARGRHLAAIQQNGLRIESPHGDAVLPDIYATQDPSEIGSVDLILFTVKLGDSETAAEMMAPLVGPQTRVLTLQNGIDSKDMLARYVPRERVAAGVIYIASYIKEPGVIINPGGMHRIMAERLGGDPVMAGLFGACDRAVGLVVEPRDDAEQGVWEKFIALVAFSGVTCISRLPIGAVYEHPQTLALMRALLEENVAVAQARGLDFDDEETDRVIAVFGKQPYEHKSSMLVDLECGRALELAWLSGRVCALGEELAIATPANRAVVAALAPYVDGPPTLKRDLRAGLT